MAAKSAANPKPILTPTLSLTLTLTDLIADKGDGGKESAAGGKDKKDSGALDAHA